MTTSTRWPQHLQRDGEVLLAVDRLTVKFGGVVALDEMSFAVQSGTIHGLIGPNGSGKTTCLNVLSGFVKPFKGTIRFNGARLERLAPHRRAQLGLGRTFQSNRILPASQALDHVLLGRHTRDRSTFRRALVPLIHDRTVARERISAARWLEPLGLLHRATDTASSLAYGEQRRLDVARALAGTPELLLLDEPAAGLGAAEIELVIERILKLHATGLTVLLVEHSMPLVMRLCDRITVLNFGKVLAEGAPEEIQHDKRVIDAYLGDEL